MKCAFAPFQEVMFQMIYKFVRTHVDVYGENQTLSLNNYVQRTQTFVFLGKLIWVLKTSVGRSIMHYFPSFWGVKDDMHAQ